MASPRRPEPLPAGIDPACHVIPGENEAELGALIRAYYDEHRPQTPTERRYVDRLILCDWHGRRYSRIEAELFRHLIAEEQKRRDRFDRSAPVGQQFVSLCRSSDAAVKIFRQMNANDRTYERTLKSLREVQARRPAPVPDPPAAETATLRAVDPAVKADASPKPRLAPASSPRTQPLPIRPAAVPESPPLAA